MIKKEMALKLFDAFSIIRWNDRVRPFEIIEMDKHAFKMIIAYFLAKEEENKGRPIDWIFLIEGGIFALLKNIALSDIKAPVMKAINEKSPEIKKPLNNWVVDQYKALIDGKFISKFDTFLNGEIKSSNNTFNVLRAAHKYSTLREFKIIKPLNLSFSEIYEIEKELNNAIVEALHLDGMKKIIAKQNLYDLLCYIEQLKFQTRWSQTQRIPKTSVLGHSMYVATTAYLMAYNKYKSVKTLYNTFFCGLFHDLPECVTRDIISPVKNSTRELPDIVKEIEHEIVKEKLFPIMETCFKEDISYFINDEFDNKYKDNNKVVMIEPDENIHNYDEERYCLLPGKLLKIADEVAAYIEAKQSVEYGIKSTHILNGIKILEDKYKHHPEKEIKSFFNDFQ